VCSGTDRLIPLFASKRYEEVLVKEIDVPVLIVGGSLVGLSASVALAAHGVPNLVVERHRGTAIHPRAAMFHQRTTEIFRELGVLEEVERAAEREFLQNGAIMAVESLGGKELVYFQENVNEGVEHLSPAPRLFITQIGLEPILRERAAALGAEHRFAAEVVEFSQDDTGVRAVVRDRDTGEETLVRAQYLIAADGAHSATREQLGIGMLGRGKFSDCITIYFKADVSELIGERNLSVTYVNHPDLLAFFRFSFAKDSGFLAVFKALDADGQPIADIGATADDLALCTQFVRTALGVGEELPIEIDSVQRWAAESGWAERFRDRRVFLIGDAVHVMPPTGGFGGNTGIIDAHNLAWKIAAVLQGKAGEGLLDTYDPERRPAAAMTAEQAYTRYVLRVDQSLGTDDLQETLDDVAIELGPVYSSAGVASGTPDAAGGVGSLHDRDSRTQNPREPGAAVGGRAPHVAVSGAGRTSVHDVFGDGFVLLAGASGDAWLDAAAGARIPGYRVGPGVELDAAAGAFEEAYGVGADGAVLVRPDGVIAWASPTAAGASAAALDAVLDALLFRAAARVG